MKHIIAQFNISKDQLIEVYFPDLKNKINYYYEPTQKLHKFDEVLISYNDKNKNIAAILHKDILDDGFISMAEQLKRASQKKIELPPQIQVGTLTHCFNESYQDNANQICKNIKFKNYWVWGMPSGGAQTFMYTVDDVLYLEIGLSYKWNTQDREESDTDYITYDEFKKNYKPILVTQISHETARKWLEICNFVLEEIE